MKNVIDNKNEYLHSINTKRGTREGKCIMLTDIIERLNDVGIKVIVLDGGGELAYFPQLQMLYLHQDTPLKKAKIITEYILNNTPDFTPDL